MDWKEILPNDINFIFGNPPFVGYKLQNSEQKSDLRPLFEDIKNIDYVAGWYFKTAKFIQGKKIEAAFVSTNSITQGEQVTAIWENLPVEINFAYRSFKWDSELQRKPLFIV